MQGTHTALPPNTHFSQARLVSFLTITMSPLLLAGVSTASVSFQCNYMTVKVKGTFLFQSPARSDEEGWEWGVEEVRFSTGRWNCETGLLDVAGKVENLSAKVVNLFLASSFPGGKKGERKKQGNSLSAAPVAWCWPWRYGTKWHDRMPRVPTLTLNFTSNSFHWVSKLEGYWGVGVNSYLSHLFFASKAWGGLFVLYRCYNKAVVFFPFLEDCLCLAACFDGCKTNKIRPSSPTESDSWEENPMKGCRGNEQRKSRVGSRWLSWEHTANSVKKNGGVWGTGPRLSLLFFVASPTLIILYK